MDEQFSNAAKEYFQKKSVELSSVKQISIDEFNAKKNEFADGPYMESFGDGYGEPYYPNRQVFGVLKDGTPVLSRQK